MVEFFPKINSRGATAIRDSRVLTPIYYLCIGILCHSETLQKWKITLKQPNVTIELILTIFKKLHGFMFVALTIRIKVNSMISL